MNKDAVRQFLDYTAGDPGIRKIFEQTWDQLDRNPIQALRSVLAFGLQAHEHEEGRGFFLGVLAGVVIAEVSGHSLFDQALKSAFTHDRLHDIVDAAKRGK